MTTLITLINLIRDIVRDAKMLEQNEREIS
jgi:hypothetical protein